MSRIKIVKKPWGEEHLFALSDKYAGKILVINRGHRLSLQYHKRKEETLYILDGILRLTIGKSKKDLVKKIVRAGYVFHLPPKMIHRMEAVKKCHLVEVSTPELMDVVRIEDDYNRSMGKK